MKKKAKVVEVNLTQEQFDQIKDVVCSECQPDADTEIQQITDVLRNGDARDAFFSLDKPDTETSNVLRKGFINCGINPYTGKTVDSSAPNIFLAANYAIEKEAYHKDEILENHNGEGQPFNPISLGIERSAIKLAFANYVYNSINQMVQLANLEFSNLIIERLTKKQLDALSDSMISYNRGRYDRYDRYDDDLTKIMFMPFDSETFTSYDEGTFSFNRSIPGYGHTYDKVEDQANYGTLMSLETYMICDIGTILTILIPCFETMYLRLTNNISNMPELKNCYDIIVSTYNECQFKLLFALENVMSIIYKDSDLYIHAGGSGCNSVGYKDGLEMAGLVNYVPCSKKEK